MFYSIETDVINLEPRLITLVPTVIQILGDTQHEIINPHGVEGQNQVLQLCDALQIGGCVWAFRSNVLLESSDQMGSRVRKSDSHYFSCILGLHRVFFMPCLPMDAFSQVKDYSVTSKKAVILHVTHLFQFLYFILFYVLEVTGYKHKSAVCFLL